MQHCKDTAQMTANLLARGYRGRNPGLPNWGNKNSIPASENVFWITSIESLDSGGVPSYSSSLRMTAGEMLVRAASSLTDQFKMPRAARICAPVSPDGAGVANADSFFSCTS